MTDFDANPIGEKSVVSQVFGSARSAKQPV